MVKAKRKELSLLDIHSVKTNMAQRGAGPNYQPKKGAWLYYLTPGEVGTTSSAGDVPEASRVGMVLDTYYEEQEKSVFHE